MYRTYRPWISIGMMVSATWSISARMRAISAVEGSWVHTSRPAAVQVTWAESDIGCVTSRGVVQPGSHRRLCGSFPCPSVRSSRVGRWVRPRSRGSSPGGGRGVGGGGRGGLTPRRRHLVLLLFVELDRVLEDL